MLLFKELELLPGTILVLWMAREALRKLVRNWLMTGCFLWPFNRRASAKSYFWHPGHFPCQKSFRNKYLALHKSQGYSKNVFLVFNQQQDWLPKIQGGWNHPPNGFSAVLRFHGFHAFIPYGLFFNSVPLSAPILGTVPHQHS